MDNEYQQKRQVEKFRQRPRNAIEGIGYGLKDLGTGIIKGLYGIVVRSSLYRAPREAVCGN